jgi:beta-N-acetylhexosaminidase
MTIGNQGTNPEFGQDDSQAGQEPPVRPSERNRIYQDKQRKSAQAAARRPPLSEQIAFPLHQTWPATPVPAVQPEEQSTQALDTPPQTSTAQSVPAPAQLAQPEPPPQAPNDPPAVLKTVRPTRTPTPSPPLHTPQPRLPPRRHHAIQIAITLVLLAILTIFGSFIGLRLLGGPTTRPSISFTTAPVNPGPFVQPPLTSEQIDALRHLSQHMQYKQLASLYVSRMSLDEELGQLIMVEYADTYYSPDLDTMVNKLHAGGVIMYEFQMLTLNQTKHDITQMQQNATFPLLISTDEEGGPYVHRLTHIYPPRMSALDIYNTGDPAVATREGHHVAHDLLSLGINVNLTPDVDVALVNGPDQVTRTFGYTTDSVIKFAGPYMQAMQSDGVIACIKHYPGLGDASIDAHFGLPVVNRTKDQIYSVELAPFKYFIQTQDKLENPGMIMPTDVLMPAIDPTMPAELSHIFMTDILRKQMGYDGVVLTDALYMQGVKINGAQISMPQAAVMALNAGNDMLLGPTGSAQMLDMINGLKAALQNGTLSKARIDEAATRIIALKMERHLMPAVPPMA